MSTQSLFLIFLLLYWSVDLIAQPDWMPDYNKSQSLTLRFEAIGPEDGLPHKTVQALFQDHLGFIWLGTPTGLVKYDGYTFQTYQYKRAEADSSITPRPLSVNAIAEDANGDLWIGCLYSRPDQPVLFRFDRKTERLIPLLFDEEADSTIIQSHIKNIHIGHGFIWIDAARLFRLPDRSIQKIRTEGLSFTAFGEETWKGRRISFSRIYEDTRGRIWSAARGGIHEWLPKRDSFAFHPLPDSFLGEGEQNPFIINLVETNSGGIVVIPQIGYPLIYFSPKNGAYRKMKVEQSSFDPILLDTKDGQWWFGSRGGRGMLKVLDTATGQMQEVDMQVEDADFFPIARVLCMIKDINGSIWVGTRDGPLLRYDPQRNHFQWLRFRPESPQTLPHNSVNGLKQDRDGHYWITTFGGGLVQWKRRENSFTNFRAKAGQNNGPLSDFLLGLDITPDGKIWFGEGFSAGAYNPATGQFDHYRESGVVMTVFNDSRSRIWLAKFGGGLRRYDPAKDDFVKVGLPLPPNPSQRIFPYLGGIFEDSRGMLWLGSYSPGIGGFFRFDPETERCQFFHLPEAHDFHEDGRGYVWIASVDGLYRYDPEKQAFKRYGVQDGLSNNVVQAIEEDDHGRLWIGTDNGLSRFDPRTETFRNYFQSDGLPGNEFYYPAYKNKDGELFFWGQSGVVYFHPDSIQDNAVLPQLAFTGIDLFGKPVPIEADGPLQKHISVTSRLELSHWQNDLSLHYAALHYKNPEKNHYQVRLENYDQTWRQVGTQRTASYTNLDPGRYTFRVQAANSDGIWNEEGIALDIVIHPPWYWTWWSQALYLLLITSLILGVYRFQLNRRLALAEATRLRELDEVKTKLYTNITHEFRTPLTVIQGVAEQIRDHAEEKELIHRNSRQLLDLINKMLDLSKIEAGKLHLHLIHADILSFLRYVTESFHSLALNQKINLNFYADAETLEMDYDPEKILQVLSNLISNAVKFTPEYGKVQVTARQEAVDGGHVLLLKVRDTGIGIAAEQLPHIFDRFYQANASNTRRAEGTGIGLALTRELVVLMSGRIEVESRVGEGTIFTVQLPIEEKSRMRSQQSGFSGTKAGSSGSAIDVVLERIASSALDEQSPTTAKQSTSKNDYPALASRPIDFPTLLIVEDNADVREYLASCLQEEYELTFARNGREGIGMALEDVPDLIISDVMMPEADGFELCRTLKQDERTSHIPIILLTAKADMDSKLEGLEYGADAYLFKPFHRRELDVRLRKLVELRRKLQAKYNQPEFAIESETAKEDAFVKKVRQLVLDNLDDTGFGIEELSRALFLSRTHLYRKLKALTGKSTSHFVRQVRLQESYRLLKEGELNVTEVAFAVGFSDPAYFSKLFSQTFGRSPSKI